MTTLANGTALSRAAYDALPDPADGRRWEYVGGALHVRSSPGVRHQDVMGNVWSLLRRVIPATQKVSMAFAWQAGDDEFIRRSS